MINICSCHKKQVLYLSSNGDHNGAIKTYIKNCKKSGKHDFEILHQIASIILNQGIRSNNIDDMILSIYGAGISMNDQMIGVLQKGLLSDNLMAQYLSLNFIAQFDSKTSDNILAKTALQADNLNLKMQACYYMSQRSHSYTANYSESLMIQLPAMLHPLFAPIFARLDTPASSKILRDMINSANPQTRLATILSIAQNKKGEFLDDIKKRLKYGNTAEIEASIFALESLKSSVCLKELKELCSHHIEFIKLSSLRALKRLGDDSVSDSIADIAKNGNIFAIYMLGELGIKKDILVDLTKSKDLIIKINALYALFLQKDPKYIDQLCNMLFESKRLKKVKSLGRSLSAINYVVDADEFEYLSFKIDLLNKISKISDDAFINAATKVFDKHEKELIPTVIQTLERINTKKSRNLLKKGSNKLGHPLIRNYCNLSLYRLKEKGPYKKEFLHWLTHRNKTSPTPLKPSEYRIYKSRSPHIMTKDQAISLIIDGISTLAEQQDASSIYDILDLLLKGHPSNRYIIAGILMRCTE